MLNKIWKDRTNSLNTKLRIYNSNVNVLYYGCETWKTNVSCVKQETPDFCQSMSAEDSEDTMDREGEEWKRTGQITGGGWIVQDH